MCWRLLLWTCSAAVLISVQAIAERHWECKHSKGDPTKSVRELLIQCDMNGHRVYQFEINPGSSSYINVICSTNEINIDDIEIRSKHHTDYNIESLNDFFLVNCPVPNAPNAQVMKKFGVATVKRLSVFKVTNSQNLTRAQLEGLNEMQIEILEVKESNVKNIDPDTFNAIPDLRQLLLNRNSLVLDDCNLFKPLIKLEELNLGSCNLTDIPEGIFELPSLKRLFLYKNKLALSEKTLSNASSLELLDLEHNSLETLPPKLLDLLPNLKKLKLAYNKIVNLPSELFLHTTKLEIIDFESNKLENLPQEIFKTLKMLKILNASYNYLERLPANIFSSSPLLHKIRLDNNQLEMLLPDTFNEQKQLTVLYLSKNFLSVLPDRLFYNQESLKELYLDHNQLVTVKGTFSMFPSLPRLERVDLQWNNLTEIHFREGLNIQYLDMSHNKLSNYYKVEIQSLSQLKNLSLSHNNFSGRIHAEWLFLESLVNLSFLDLSHNRINAIETIREDLSFNKIQNFNLDLSHNNITTIYLPDLEEFNSKRSINNTYTIAVNFNPFVCDCFIYNFFVLKQNKSSPIQMLADDPGSRCRAPASHANKSLSTVSPNDLVCSLAQLTGPLVNSSLYIQPATKARILNCTNSDIDDQTFIDWKSLDGRFNYSLNHMYNHTELVLENRNLTNFGVLGKIPTSVTVLKLRGNRFNLREGDIPPHIEKLDLRNNEIDHLNSSVAAMLVNGSSLKELWLSGNPLACDCHNQDLIGFLQAHYKYTKVIDYDDLKCSDKGEIKNANVGDLCTASYVYVFAALTFAVLASVVAVSYKYKYWIKSWLFWNCFWVIPEVDKDYDIAIIHSEEDKGTVTNIYNRLAVGPTKFEIDLSGNWMPGHSKTALISDKIRRSKRIVILLTPHLVQSEYLQYIFDISSENRGEENIHDKVVILICDKFDITELDLKLRAFIATCTCIKWRGWEHRSSAKQVIFALPHTNTWLKQNYKKDAKFFERHLPEPPELGIVKTRDPVFISPDRFMKSSDKSVVPVEVGEVYTRIEKTTLPSEIEVRPLLELDQGRNLSVFNEQLDDNVALSGFSNPTQVTPFHSQPRKSPDEYAFDDKETPLQNSPFKPWNPPGEISSSDFKEMPVENSPFKPWNPPGEISSSDNKEMPIQNSLFKPWNPPDEISSSDINEMPVQNSPFKSWYPPGEITSSDVSAVQAVCEV